MQVNAHRHFPATRLRRIRNHAFARNLLAETHLATTDLILPVFVCEDEERETKISTMPGVERVPLRQLSHLGKRAQKLGIPALALFPVVPASQKTPYASEAYNADGLIPRALRLLKKSCPQLGLITDVALDPYTADGHDGISNQQGQVINDGTLHILKRQALCLAEAGSHILAPSDMMDGRIGYIRTALEQDGYQETMLLSYAAKYASSFYGPFRAALGSVSNLGQRDKKSYQMDPANSDEALQEIALDIEEGADLVMVKPGMCYLDIVHLVKTKFKVPTLAYQVSGEYAMLSMAGRAGGNEAALFLEALLAFKRAGADGIFSYYALQAAEILNGA